MTSQTPLRPALTTAHLAMALFYIQPFSFGTWLAMIPAVKQALGLSDGALALALFGMPLAIVPMLPLAGRVVARYGPRRTMASAFPVQVFLLWLIVQAPGQWSLFLALMLFGAIGPFLQVGLNVYAGRLEKAEGAFIMSRCHGFWALGVMSGSILAVAALGLGWSLTQIALSVAMPSAAIGIMLARSLPQIGTSEDVAPPRRRLRELPSALWVIAAFAMGIALTEGAMSDWSAVYMTSRLDGDAARGALAVTLYSMSVAVGRFSGDGLRARWGSAKLARSLAVLALVGVILLVLPFGPWAAWAGFILVGLGVSVGFPLAVSAAAALDDTHEAANIAVLSTIAISGFLVGPPVIGTLAEFVSLRVGLMVLVPILAACVWLAGRLRA